MKLYNKRYFINIALIISIVINILLLVYAIKLKNNNDDLKTTINNVKSDKLRYTLIYHDIKEHKVDQKWEDNFPSSTSTRLINKSPDEVRSILGIPYITISKVNEDDDKHEMLIYMPNVNKIDQDNTGIYLYFKNEKLVSSRIDDFNGVIEKDLESYFKN